MFTHWMAEGIQAYTLMENQAAGHWTLRLFTVNVKLQITRQAEEIEKHGQFRKFGLSERCIRGVSDSEVENGRLETHSICNGNKALKVWYLLKS